MDPETYRQNKDFWDRAWSGVKTPYTQMPPLPYLERIPAALKDCAGGKVLDLGCGSGWLAVYLAREGFYPTGVDVAGHALELAKMWAAQENLSIDFSTADIAELDFEDASFDAVVGNSIFEHLTLELSRKCIGNLFGMLKPGGIFIGCFDRVGTGPGEYNKLADGTQVYTDKGRQGMILRNFTDEEIKALLSSFDITEFDPLESGTRFVTARKPP